VVTVGRTLWVVCVFVCACLCNVDVMFINA